MKAICERCYLDECQRQCLPGLEIYATRPIAVLPCDLCKDAPGTVLLPDSSIKAAS